MLRIKHGLVGCNANALLSECIFKTALQYQDNESAFNLNLFKILIAPVHRRMSLLAAYILKHILNVFTRTCYYFNFTIFYICVAYEIWIKYVWYSQNLEGHTVWNQFVAWHSQSAWACHLSHTFKLSLSLTCKSANLLYPLNKISNLLLWGESQDKCLFSFFWRLPGAPS